MKNKCSVAVKIYGFRAGYFCSTQFVSPFIEDFNRHADHNTQIDIILLDFSKVFDTVLHCRWLKKLKFTTKKVTPSAGLKNGLQHVGNKLDGESSDYICIWSTPGYSIGSSDVINLYQ